MAVLEVTGITKLYGGGSEFNSTKALNGIELSIEKGEFVGIMGASGSGKTTLLNIMSGILKPTSGEVHINQTSLHSLSKDEMALFRRHHLGFVFQDFNLLDSLTLKENIMLPMVLDKQNVTEMDTRTEELIRMMNLSDAKNKYPWQVSGGQVQRACIARSMINNPALLFADEPTGNLDSNTSRSIMEHLEKLNKTRQSTILLVTHDPFSASFCNRIIFIKDGLNHMEISKKKDRKEFFERILDCLAILGGAQNDLP